MCHFTPPGSQPCGFLEPLDGFPLRLPFPEVHPCLSGLGIAFHGFTNETPSSVADTLPTPGPPPLGPVLTETHGNFPGLPPDVPLFPLVAEAIIPPPAPHLRDLDSFSEGTALGSFNFTMSSECDDAGLSASVAFSPSHPMRSIEVWRDNVHHCAASERGDTAEERATKRRRVSEASGLEPENAPSASEARRSLHVLPISPSSSGGDEAEEPSARVETEDTRPWSAPDGLG